MKPTSKYLYFLIFLFSVLFSPGQKQANNWLFGSSQGLNFNTTPPSFISGNMTTIGGWSAISDEDGSLLFFTNGQTIWDQSHTIMSNGNGLFGGNSSAQ